MYMHLALWNVGPILVESLHSPRDWIINCTMLHSTLDLRYQLWGIRREAPPHKPRSLHPWDWFWNRKCNNRTRSSMMTVPIWFGKNNTVWRKFTLARRRIKTYLIFGVTEILKHLILQWVRHTYVSAQVWMSPVTHPTSRTAPFECDLIFPASSIVEPEFRNG